MTFIKRKPFRLTFFIAEAEKIGKKVARRQCSLSDYFVN
jgi:hypothetical protein